MKNRIFFLLLLVCAFLPASSQDTAAVSGIRFEDLSLREAMAKAKTEGKKVFVDCYTQTCGPCKYMMKNIFPLKECGDYFNPRYVSLARDMNVGEGPEMGRKYEVGIYPTFLIINPDGTLYCKEIGAVRLNSKVSFVEKMKRAVERTELAVKYDAGERDGQLVRRYAELLRESGDRKADEVVNDYLLSMTVDELCREDNWQMMVTDVRSPEAPVFRRLLDERETFGERLGRKTVEDKLLAVYKDEFDMYKKMGMDFARRIQDLSLLEKEGCGRARPLAECMTLRWIIDGKQKGRMAEIVAILERLGSLPTDKDRMAVIRELSGFERVADTRLRAKACKALEKNRKSMSEADSAATAKTISRISPDRQ